MSAKFHDALHMCTRLGTPSFFITFTANPKWQEITTAIRETSPTSTAMDRSDIIARVFKLKLEELMHDLMHKQVLGRMAGISMVIEYQKRDLPHAHIVLIIHPEDRHKTADDIDKLVSAEIPREPTEYDDDETRENLIQGKKWLCRIWLMAHVVQRIPVSVLQTLPKEHPETSIQFNPF